MLRETVDNTVAIVTAWGCWGDSAFVLSSLETSAVVTMGIEDF